jgi:hypothetical protein
MKKSGQAALEFLTTYGWALLVILVMIGALVYFGVLNPSKALPTKCLVPPGFDCANNFQITEDGFEMILANKQGDAIRGLQLASDPSSDDYIGAGITSADCSITPTVVNADEKFTISCTAADPAEVFEGLSDKVKIEFAFNYTVNRQTYGKIADVSLYGPVVQ